MPAYSEMLDGFTRQRGVQGGLVVSERDGIVVDTQVQLGVRASVVAALAASIYRKARLSAEAAGLGGWRTSNLPLRKAVSVWSAGATWSSC